MIIGLYKIVEHAGLKSFLIEKLVHAVIIAIILVVITAIIAKKPLVSGRMRGIIIIGILITMIYVSKRFARIAKLIGLCIWKMIQSMYLYTYNELRSDGMDVLTSGFVAALVCGAIILIII